jgi:hypothetical protein
VAVVTGPALARLLASTRTTEHGAQLYRDAYEAGLEDAAQVRGSAARYWRDLRRTIGSWEYYEREARERAEAYRVSARTTGRAIADTMLRGAEATDRRARSYASAIRRARAILQRLDGERMGR